jgi:hypothetical protein
LAPQKRHLTQKPEPTASASDEALPYRSCQPWRRPRRTSPPPRFRGSTGCCSSRTSLLYPSPRTATSRPPQPAELPHRPSPPARHHQCCAAASPPLTMLCPWQPCHPPRLARGTAANTAADGSTARTPALSHLSPIPVRSVGLRAENVNSPSESPKGCRREALGRGGPCRHSSKLPPSLRRLRCASAFMFFLFFLKLAVSKDRSCYGGPQEVDTTPEASRHTPRPPPARKPASYNTVPAPCPDRNQANPAGQ